MGTGGAGLGSGPARHETKAVVLGTAGDNAGARSARRRWARPTLGVLVRPDEPLASRGLCVASMWTSSALLFPLGAEVSDFPTDAVFALEVEYMPRILGYSVDFLG